MCKRKKTKILRKSKVFFAIASAILASNVGSTTPSPLAAAFLTSGDAINASIGVGSSQSSLNATRITKTLEAAIAQSLVVQSGYEKSKNIKQAIEDITPGKGITPHFTCVPLDESKKQIENKQKSEIIASKMTSASNQATQSSSIKMAIRANSHLSHYCDPTEAARNLCLLAVGRRAGMDVSYSTISQNRKLDDEEQQASHHFVRNVIDPVQTDLGNCNSPVCRSLQQAERSVMAVGSLIQHSLNSQIADSVAYTVPLGEIENIKLKQDPSQLSLDWDGKLEYNSGNTTNEQGSSYSVYSLDLGPLPQDIQQLVSLLADTVDDGESSNTPGGWNASNNGNPKENRNTIACARGSGGVFDLINMTIGQVLALQDRRVQPYSKSDCSGLFVAGKYQMRPAFIRENLPSSGLTTKDLFSPENQKKIAMAHINRTAGCFWRGSCSKDKAKEYLARAWASLGKPGNPSKSWYDKGGNHANTKVTLAVWRILDEIETVNNQRK